MKFLKNCPAPLLKSLQKYKLSVEQFKLIPEDTLTEQNKEEISKARSLFLSDLDLYVGCNKNTINWLFLSLETGDFVPEIAYWFVRKELKQFGSKEGLFKLLVKHYLKADVEKFDGVTKSYRSYVIACFKLYCFCLYDLDVTEAIYFNKRFDTIEGLCPICKSIGIRQTNLLENYMLQYVCSCKEHDSYTVRASLPLMYHFDKILKIGEC